MRSLTSVKCRCRLKLFRISATSPRPAMPRTLICFLFSLSVRGAAILLAGENGPPKEAAEEEDFARRQRCALGGRGF